MRGSFLFLLIVSSCALRPERDPIVVPELSKDFYREAVYRMESILSENTNNEVLIRSQLDYFEQLGWPPEANKAIRRARKILMLDLLLARKYADFYMRNGHHHSIIALERELARQYKIPDWLTQYTITALNRNNRKSAARNRLKLYIRNATSVDYHFIGTEYLEQGDTLLSVYNLLKVDNGQEKDPAFLKLVMPLLFELKLYEPLVDLATPQVGLDIVDFNFYELLGHSLRETGQKDRAKQLLWERVDRRRLLQLSTWYQEDRLWDSAHFCLDKILVADHDDLDALFYKAEIDHERGWLSRAVSTYQRVIELDSGNVRATKQLDLVNRKIAYLRKVRDAKESIPIIEIDAKKVVD